MDSKDESNNAVAGAEKSYGEVLEDLYAVTPEILEIVKLRIAFWDKLVILNAGSLALSVSAAASFRGHTIGDAGVGYLFASWKLMILAIVFSMIAQWAATSSATYLRRQLTSLRTHLKLANIRRDLERGGVNPSDPLAKLTDDAGRDVDLSKRYARPFEQSRTGLECCRRFARYLLLFGSTALRT